MNLPTTILAAADATSHGLVASSTATDTEGSIVSLFIIAAAATVAPLLASLTHKRVPDVVWLLILGCCSHAMKTLKLCLSANVRL